MSATWLGVLEKTCPWLRSERRVRTFAEDCAGLGPVSYVLRELREHFGFKSSLLFACDSNPVCQTLLRRDGQACHVLKDMNVRLFRDASLVSKDIDNKQVQINARGLDLYFAGTSCKPFSSKGQRLGFKHPEAKTLVQALKTIKSVRPKAAVLENVCGLVDKRFGPQLQRLLATLTDYISREFQVNSMDFAIPQQRRRVYILLLRKDQFADPEASLDNVQSRLDSMMAVFGPCQSVLEFLEAEGMPVLADETDDIRPVCASCSVRNLCPHHVCHCKLCKHGKEPSRRCKWRMTSSRMLARPKIRRESRQYLHSWRKVLKRSELSKPPLYFQLANHRKLSANVKIRSPRVRCMLQLLSRFQNLLSPKFVLDVSQDVTRCAFRVDGLVPTLGTDCSKIFVPSKAAFLSAEQCLLLQGVDVRRHDFSCTPKKKRFELAGNGVCIPAFACVMVAVLAELP